MKYNRPIMIYAIAILSAAILLSSCGGNTAHRDSASGTEVDGSWIENPQRSLCCYYDNQYDKLAQYDLGGKFSGRV